MKIMRVVKNIVPLTVFHGVTVKTQKRIQRGLFEGEINIQTSGYQQRTQTDYQSQVQNVLNSNVSMSWREVGPLTLSTSFTHSLKIREQKMSKFNFQT